jgi:predicted alpha/beta superfamily hydrolase
MVEAMELSGFTTFDVPSDAVGDTFRITVATPYLYEAIQNPLPTMYILDGVLCLPMASGITRSLEVNAFGLMKSMICVGISYATDDPLDIMSLRTRDMTPTEGTLPPSPMPVDKFGVGGGPKFLDALTNEIMPAVEDRWRVDPSDRCLVGWSLGGLFGLYTLFNRPEAFARYLLVSPSIWWDDRAILKDEAAYAASHDDLAARVYACVGEREETAPSRMWPPVPSEFVENLMSARMVSSLEELVAKLRSRRYPSLDIASNVFEDEHHVTVFPAGFARGVHHLYA